MTIAQFMQYFNAIHKLEANLENLAFVHRFLLLEKKFGKAFAWVWRNDLRLFN